MNISVSMRLWFAFMGVILWTGIFDTGFSTVSWLLYLPAAGLTLAGVIGICPAQAAISKLIAVKHPKTSSGK